MRDFFLVLYGGGTRQEYLPPLKIGTGSFLVRNPDIAFIDRTAG